MAHLDRNDAIARIRTALKTLTGRSWSVRGNTGTAWGWIDVGAPPRRCGDFRRMTEDDQEMLARATGPDWTRMVAETGISLSPDARTRFVAMLEDRVVAADGDLQAECYFCRNTDRAEYDRDERRHLCAGCRGVEG